MVVVVVFSGERRRKGCFCFLEEEEVEVEKEKTKPPRLLASSGNRSPRQLRLYSAFKSLHLHVSEYAVLYQLS